jgi:hypothetical protein
MASRSPHHNEKFCPQCEDSRGASAAGSALDFDITDGEAAEEWQRVQLEAVEEAEPVTITPWLTR